MSDIEKITDTINASLPKFKAELLQQQEKSESRLSSKLQQNIPDFKKKGNKKQFEFNIKVQDSLQRATEHLESDEKVSALEELKQGNDFIKQRNKLIRLADRSDNGWAVVNEYITDTLASDSDDEKRIRRAEFTANKKSKSGRASVTNRGYSTSVSYFPYSRINTNIPNTESEYFRGFKGSFRRGRGRRLPGPQDVCYACLGTGHWRENCPAVTQQTGAQNASLQPIAASKPQAR